MKRYLCWLLVVFLLICPILAIASDLQEDMLSVTVADGDMTEVEEDDVDFLETDEDTEEEITAKEGDNETVSDTLEVEEEAVLEDNETLEDDELSEDSDMAEEEPFEEEDTVISEEMKEEEIAKEDEEGELVEDIEEVEDEENYTIDEELVEEDVISEEAIEEVEAVEEIVDEEEEIIDILALSDEVGSSILPDDNIRVDVLSFSPYIWSELGEKRNDMFVKLSDSIHGRVDTLIGVIEKPQSFESEYMLYDEQIPVVFFNWEEIDNPLAYIILFAWDSKTGKTHAMIFENEDKITGTVYDAEYINWMRKMVFGADIDEVNFFVVVAEITSLDEPIRFSYPSDVVTVDLSSFVFDDDDKEKPDEKEKKPDSEKNINEEYEIYDIDFDSLYDDVGFAEVYKLSVEGVVKPIFEGGVVVYVGWDNDRGNYIIIKYEIGGKTFYLLYAHLTYKPSLKVGKKVTKKDIIGQMENNGYLQVYTGAFDKPAVYYDPLKVIETGGSIIQ